MRRACHVPCVCNWDSSLFCPLCRDEMRIQLPKIPWELLWNLSPLKPMPSRRGLNPTSW